MKPVSAFKQTTLVRVATLVFKVAALGFGSVLGLCFLLARLRNKRTSVDNVQPGPPHGHPSPINKQSTIKFYAWNQSTDGRVMETEGIRVIRIIDMFVHDCNAAETFLPKDLTKADRRIAHSVAEKIGLLHDNAGDGADRQLRLRKVVGCDYATVERLQPITKPSAHPYQTIRKSEQPVAFFGNIFWQLSLAGDNLYIENCCGNRKIQIIIHVPRAKLSRVCDSSQKFNPAFGFVIEFDGVDGTKYYIDTTTEQSDGELEAEQWIAALLPKIQSETLV